MTTQETSYEAELEAERRASKLHAIDDAMPVRYHGLEPPTETAEWRETLLDGKVSNLIMTGPTGVGKTAAAWTTLRDLVDRGWLSRYFRIWKYWRASDLAAALRPNLDIEDTIESARSIALLVLDDLGSAKLTEWQLEQMHRIFDARWEANRPTMITSNLPKLRDALDDRLASRLQDGATLVTLRGTDRRRTETREVPTDWDGRPKPRQRQSWEF